MKAWRYWRNLLLFALALLIVSLPLGTVFLARQMLWDYLHPARAPRSRDDTPARYAVSYQDVVVTTHDGLELAAWYTPPQNGAVILIGHGYADRRSPEKHALFARNGYGAISWDFRAHGDSEGELCSLGYYEALDVEAALDFALSQPSVKAVGAWGGSMGGVAAILAAARRPEIGAVAIDSAYAALEEEFEMAIGYGFMRPLIRFLAERQTGVSVDELRPVDQIWRISPRPVLIIQGLDDGVIPASSGQSLYDAAGEPRILWAEPGVGHLGLFKQQPDEYEQRVTSFFDEALLP